MTPEQRSVLQQILQAKGLVTPQLPLANSMGAIAGGAAMNANPLQIPLQRVPQVGMQAPPASMTPDPRDAQISQLQGQYNSLNNAQEPWWQTMLKGLSYAGGATNAAQANLMAQRGHAGDQQDRQAQMQNTLAMLKNIQDQKAQDARAALEQAQERRANAITEKTGALTDLQAENEKAQIEERKQLAAERERKATSDTYEKFSPGDLVIVHGPNGVEKSRFTVPAKEETKAPKVNFSNDGIPMSITRGADDFVIGDPNMPPELKSIADAAVRAHSQRLSEQASIADTLAQKQEARAEAAAKRAQDIKNSTADDSTKNLINAGYMTHDSIQNVRELMQAYPDLVGPALGRAEQAAQGMGTSFGFQDKEREKAAAQLSKNFADLLINEARAASPSRTSKELVSIVKSATAQMSQNPNMIEGFLNGAEQSAQRAINVGRRWGIDLEGGGGKTGVATGAPKAGWIIDPGGTRHYVTDVDAAIKLHPGTKVAP